jgi:hypothetical protein
MAGNAAAISQQQTSRVTVTQAGKATTPATRSAAVPSAQNKEAVQKYHYSGSLRFLYRKSNNLYTELRRT